MPSSVSTLMALADEYAEDVAIDAQSMAILPSRAALESAITKALADERERAALVCESKYPEMVNGQHVELQCFMDGTDCATAIRSLK